MLSFVVTLYSYDFQGRIKGLKNYRLNRVMGPFFFSFLPLLFPFSPQLLSIFLLLAFPGSCTSFIQLGIQGNAVVIFKLI